MATRTAVERDAPPRDWPRKKARTGAKALERAGLGRIAWVAAAVALTLASLASVRPVNWAVRWTAAWVHNHAAALADSLTHTRHRPPGGYPRPFHGALLAGQGMPVVLVILVVALAGLTWAGLAPALGRAARIAGVAVIVAAVAMVAVGALGWTAADAVVLRAVGSTAHFLGGWVASVEMTS